MFLVDDERTLYVWQGAWPDSSEEEENVTTGSAHARLNAERIAALQTCLQYAKGAVRLHFSRYVSINIFYMWLIRIIKSKVTSFCTYTCTCMCVCYGISAKNSQSPVECLLVFGGVEPLAFQNLFPVWQVDEKARSKQLQVCALRN